jgi:nucleotide-binding universal stress UspA family protein
MMKILLGYDGSEGADAALNDLKRAGLPDEAEALIVSVADIMMAPATSNYEIAGQALTSRRLTAGLMLAEKQTARALSEAKAITTKASERVRSNFPGWDVRAEVLAGQPSQELIRRAEKWLSFAFQEPFQNQCLIVLFVSSRMDQGDRSFPCFLLEYFDQILVMPDLSFIAPAETLPFVRIMPKPFTQLRAGGDIF